MKHDEIIAEIQKRASDRGLLSHYCPDSRRCDGNRGFPDMLVAGSHGALFLEVKTGHDSLKPDQLTWSYTLLAAGELVLVIREQDLADDGGLDQLLEKIQLGLREKSI